MVLSFHRRTNELWVHEAGERKRRNETPVKADRTAGDASKRATVWTVIATLTLSSLTPFVPLAAAQQAGAPAKISPGAATAGLPPEPIPNATLPLYMRPGPRDFRQPRSHFPNPIAPYLSKSIGIPRVTNSPRLQDLLRDGKIYMSLGDAIMLALENNYDIAIARYNLDIADTDILRSRAGSNLLGVGSGLVTGTIGGTSTTLSSGGGPGGTTAGASGAGAGSSGLVLTTNGAGPLPEPLDPVLTGNIQLERARTPQATTFLTGTNSLTQNTDLYNFQYNQGFITGTALSVGFNNNRQTSNDLNSNYSPALQSTMRAQLTQHLLQGFGTGINGRFMVQAVNDRRITDSAFRQQLLYSINQVENIYWLLVSAYESVQSAQRALDQSTQVASDDRKQLEIGTLAPLDVLNADNQVASDKQTLITAQTNLEYQQLVIKQAVSRNLNDPTLSAAPVVPTDRVSLIEMPEETATVEQLVQQAYQSRPEIEQAVLNLKNDQLTLKGVKNGLLPTVDVYGFYGAAALGGSQNPLCGHGGFIDPRQCPVPTVGYSTTFTNLFNSSNPDKGAGVNITIPIRNRTAQALQSRSLIEFRQDQMKLEQIYTQIRMQVINGQYALTNDRAAVQAAMATREYNTQALDAEQKKFRFGASTTALVLQQERNLAASENTVTGALATYARDRASLEQILASTLDKYGISMGDAVSGKVNQQLSIPGLEAAPQNAPAAGVPSQQQQLHQTQQAPAKPPSVMPQTAPPTPPPAPATPPATPPQAQ
ncbi:MAG: TolC family protein [Acidobacteriaceae bacterium]